MPELPEVRTVVKHLNKHIQKKKIIDCDFLVEKMVKEQNVSSFKKTIIGKRINDVQNFGKFILFNLSDNKIVLSHLRMEGKYRFAKELNLLKHDHAWFKFSNGYLIYKDVRKFGTFELKNTENIYTTKPLNKLGKLPREITVKELQAKLAKKTIAVKSALLDQTIILGLGNIYVDEVLFASKILPTRKANALKPSEIKKIIETSRTIMEKATAAGGSSIRSYRAFGEVMGDYQNYLAVHTKNGDKCNVCNATIEKMKVNGRGTYYCPKCQK